MRWLVVAWLGWASAAVADVTEADRLFEAGRDRLAADDYRGACELFDRARALDREAPGTLLNLGLCHEKLGDVVAALRWYREAEDTAIKKLMPKVAAAAHDKLRELGGQIATLHVTAPADATVTLDGAPVAREALDHLPVNPGKHVVAITLPGQPPHATEVVARPGVAQTVDMIAGPPPVVHHSGRRKLGFIVGGIGGGLLLGQAAVGFGGRLAGETNDGAWHTFTRYGLFGAGIVGAAGLVTGLVLVVTAPKDETPAVAPVLGPDRVGVAIGGRF